MEKKNLFLSIFLEDKPSTQKSKKININPNNIIEQKPNQPIKKVTNEIIDHWNIGTKGDSLYFYVFYKLF